MTRAQAEATDQMSRSALRRLKLDAFDNVDVDRLLSEGTIGPERAEWIARHLLRHGRGIEAYRTGQQTLEKLSTVDVA